MAIDTAKSFVSIHAARAGSDLRCWRQVHGHFVVSIHAARAGSDARLRYRHSAPVGFQSTLPARAATRGTDPCSRLNRCFNPRCPRGQRRDAAQSFAPCFVFQSTLPARAATCSAELRARRGAVSIHAARAGSDHVSPLRRSSSYRSFNPRCPRGQRQDGADRYRHAAGVSIHAARAGSDLTGTSRDGACQRVSIHAARAGSDQLEPWRLRMSAQFQSTLPARAATRPGYRAAVERKFQSTLPARAATQRPCSYVFALPVSIHAARAGSDHFNIMIPRQVTCFNPRCPRGQRLRLAFTPTESSCFNPRCPRGQRPARL